MPYLERQGKPTLHYELDDYTDPWKNAPYLLLQHGWARSGRFWYCWVPYLSRFYKVIRPDLRGLGLSSREFDLDRDSGLEAHCGDLNALIDHLGAESVHFCGESMGGALGMAFAADYPRRVRTLSVVSSPTHFGGPDKQTSSFGYASRIEALQKMGVKAWAEASNVGRRFPPDTDPDLLRWFVEETAGSDLHVLVALYRWVSSFDVQPYLPRIKAPVLGLYPSSGAIHGDLHAELLASQANARIVHVPSRYHNIERLEPAACALAVLHFAAEYDGLICRE